MIALLFVGAPVNGHAVAQSIYLTQLAAGDAVPPLIDRESVPTGTDKSSTAGAMADSEGEAADNPRKSPSRLRVIEVLNKKYPEGADDLWVIQSQVRVVSQQALLVTLGIEMGEWSGSGVLVSPDGLVLTAGHVVGKPQQRAEFIFPDGRRVEGRMLGINRRLDCGMMQINAAGGPWPCATLAEPGTLRLGDWVIATGQPGGYEKDRTPPVRLGRVLYLDDELITTDCTLVGGDSGGPLFDLQGQLVGIHSRIGEGITSNFHVPVAAYQADWGRLVAGEMWGGPLEASEPTDDQPMLGLAGRNMDGDVQVTQVFPDRPAARAGIQMGDVVRQFGEHPIRSMGDLGRQLLSKRPGQVVNMEVQRGRRRVSVRVKLGGIGRRFPGGLVIPGGLDPEG